MNNASIESFLKKYRLAIANESKEIRLTLNEVGDIVASIAQLNLQNDQIAKLHTKVDNLTKLLVENNSNTSSIGLDGGKFGA